MFNQGANNMVESLLSACQGACTQWISPWVVEVPTRCAQAEDSQCDSAGGHNSLGSGTAVGYRAAFSPELID